MKEDNQGWETPQLIVITRQQPTANVLAACKSGYSAGSNETDGNCYHGGFQCATCSSRPNS
ncbi:MAG: hypothetical protein C0399_04190 [Syntrophus sp. (in: bacteria)]|nr:hypothetical protein [Syntrophus sp. (in: bacteria)]